MQNNITVYDLMMFYLILILSVQKVNYFLKKERILAATKNNLKFFNKTGFFKSALHILDDGVATPTCYKEQPRFLSHMGF